MLPPRSACATLHIERCGLHDSKKPGKRDFDAVDPNSKGDLS
jgi:hypothetical protein